MNDLPSGFYRAESQWLEPPEYRPHPDDAAEDITRLCKEFSKKVNEFAEEYFTDVEDSGQVEETITNLRDLITDLEGIQEEMEDAEQVIGCQPDPDAGHDDPDIGGW